MAASGLLDELFLPRREFYKVRPDVMAIVYTKTPSLVAFSVRTRRPARQPRCLPTTSRCRSSTSAVSPGGEQGGINTPAIGKAPWPPRLVKNTTMLLFGGGAVIASGSTGNVVNAALDLRTGADNRLFEIAVGATPNHMVYTRKQAIPEAGGSEDTGPSGRVERINRFAAFLQRPRRPRPRRGCPAPDTGARPPTRTPIRHLIEELVIANRLMASDDHRRADPRRPGARQRPAAARTRIITSSRTMSRPGW